MIKALKTLQEISKRKKASSSIEIQSQQAISWFQFLRKRNLKKK